jgi:formylglycine-generating enzyme required for sulfatase activity
MAPLPKEDLVAEDLQVQREAMLERMKVVLGVSDEQLAEVRAILAKSKIVGQGNPAITKYAMTRRECRERRDAAGVVDAEEPTCGAALMAPLWNERGGETKAQAKVCIDRYEFPNVPCDYPVTWASAREAQLLCKAVGKRLCDAHEWEGACASSVLPPEEEYAFGRPRKEMKNRHNASRERVWAYGSERKLELCGMDSNKSDTCRPSGFKKCGSNSYPAGAFPQCKSAFGVYDQHGNVAEHMSLPMKTTELGATGGTGETEMKGSWFIFRKFDAHEDDCRWRAPDWHASKVMSPDSHQNYHLGFRCCRDVAR